MGILERIDNLVIALAREEPVWTVRERIARLLVDAPEALPRTYWAKEHIVRACQAFNCNTAANEHRRISTDWWLHLCLLQLRDAFLPTGSYNDQATPRNPTIASMSNREACQLSEHLAPFVVT